MEEVFDKIKEQANKAKDGAVQVTKSVLEKTNSFVNQTKLKFSISEAENKIKDVYAEIGKCVYENYHNTGVVVDGTEEKISKIDDIYDEIAELKKQLSELKDGEKCPSCGEYNDSDDLFCSKCGAKIKSEDENGGSYSYDDNVVIIKAKKPKED